MTVVRFTDEMATQYDAFISATPDTLLFASNKYRKLLKTVLKAEDHYFLSLDEKGNINGVLPSFIKEDSKLGSVLNSLPFYGSHGGVITLSGESRKVKIKLIQAFINLGKQKGCAASVLITSPFESENNLYEENIKPTHIDSRIGQLTPLLQATSIESEIDIRKKLLSIFHHKTRNMIRKAEKSGLTYEKEFTPETLKFLEKTHQINMKAVKGTAKPKAFFEKLAEVFEYKKDFELYVARYKGEPVAALLLFYYNDIVEYFTPVVVEEYRSLQPLSLLIFHAMCDSAKSGSRWWNWGGTWHSQDGVYRFKKRWGTEDKPYYYHITVNDPQILNCSKEELLSSFQYFYVAPFTALQK